MSDLSTVSIMFEEIKQYLRKIDARTSKQESIQPTNENGLDKADIAELKEVISHSEERIVSGMEDTKQSFRNEKRKVEHRISFDIKSSWVFVTMTGLILLLIIALCLFYKQWEQNGKLKDNDIKYRYVKAFNKADSVSIYKLEDIFVYNRDTKAIKKIRQSVEKHERDVADRAKRLEQAKIKEEEAEQLRKEAEELILK